MKNLYLLIFLLIFISCQKDDIYCCTNIDIDVSLAFQNQEGEDLLDPATTNSFDTDAIRIFFLIDGEKKPAYQSNLDYPRFYRVLQNSDSSYYLTLFVNDHVTDNESITYLQLSENVTDTIRCSFQTPGSSLICDKVWYNGELKYDVTTAQDARFIEIVK